MRGSANRLAVVVLMWWGCMDSQGASLEPSLDLTHATVVVRPGTLPPSESKAATVLVEEIARRTGLTLPVTSDFPGSGHVVALAWQSGLGVGPEGYRLFTETRSGNQTVAWIQGSDARGVLYGVGKFLRTMVWSPGKLWLPLPINEATSPAYPLRGHQLGYRNTANTYDAWSVGEYEQYIRDLVVFGANAIENIPFERGSPHFQLTSVHMTHELSRICHEYGIEYWVWTPAPADLNNAGDRTAALLGFDALFKDSARFDGVFIPGGDPGSNHPSLLMPYLEDVAGILHAHHPDAGVWVSIQGFESESLDYFFDYLEVNRPAWLRGVVFGPGTWLTLESVRQRTPDIYPVRFYPDITHNVRCQYPVPDWDQAFAHTVGREASNPRPSQMAWIHNRYAPYTNGFISYSDGAHDDVNKQVWSMRGWNPDIAVESILEDYARYFFGPATVVKASAGILALEKNWDGPLAANAGVDVTLDLWQELQVQHPSLDLNWRWQFCLLRAYGDAYLRARLLHEMALEAQAYDILGAASSLGTAAAMAGAEGVLASATLSPVRADLRLQTLGLCQSLWQSIHYQSSVGAPYLASGLERSAVQDLIDWPVNNRYWLEQQFDDIRSLPDEVARLSALAALVEWENPGPAGFYDDLGNSSKQPHLVQQRPWDEDPGFVESTQNEFVWHNGQTADYRRGAGRLSWQDQGQTLYGLPLQMRYTGLAPDADYVVRATYLGRFNPTMTAKADGAVLGTSGSPASAPYQIVYAIPRAATSDGTLDLSWDRVSGRGCQVAEVWLTTPDSDGDGLPDYWERRYGLNVHSSAGNHGGSGDPDLDGLTNATEFELGTLPNDPDTDHDGLNDGLEVHFHFTNPLMFDTDGGGVSDGVEVARHNDPLDPADDWRGDVNRDGGINAVDVQLVVNAVLGLPVTAPHNPDINGDGHHDALDVQLVVNKVLGSG